MAPFPIFHFAFSPISTASRASLSALRRLWFAWNSGSAWLSDIVCLDESGWRARRLSSSATCCSEDRFGLIICFSLQPEFDQAPDGCGHDYVFRFGQSTLTQAFLSHGLIVSSGRGVGHLIDRGDGHLAGRRASGLRGPCLHGQTKFDEAANGFGAAGLIALARCPSTDACSHLRRQADTAIYSGGPRMPRSAADRPSASSDPANCTFEGEALGTLLGMGITPGASMHLKVAC